MDLVGHLAVLSEAGLVPAEEAFGRAAVLGMFPNFFHCHSWGYDDLLARTPPEDDASEPHRLVWGHLATDWVIHFGTRWNSERSRTGYAYRVMDAAEGRMAWFFAEARRRGLVKDEAVFDRPAERLRRDFAHTAVECAYELPVAERLGVDRQFDRLVSSLGPLLDLDRMAATAQAVFAELGGRTEEPPSLLERSRSEYREWLDWVEDLEDFAAALFCSKFGLVQGPESSRLAKELFAHVRRTTDPADFWRCFDDCVRVVAAPEQLYAGDRP